MSPHLHKDMQKEADQDIDVYLHLFLQAHHEDRQDEQKSKWETVHWVIRVSSGESFSRCIDMTAGLLSLNVSRPPRSRLSS